ncbi:hypothetical protein PPYR_08957 [Photinus pyralis]|uniref:Zinc finger CHCC-type domain-containing protein n=1 Tax=Photinus pyralis TaxID=7054 RepID=A0A1Y1MQE5_PHOPY|nr:probable NADH dehydrogenase [ubiquinone] iron-sulfur protein 6, mitochondrial [Photinus pyralis]KAB0797964.1 hypothetical protein PPYR_08957 [Photinus pyralis]
MSRLNLINLCRKSLLNNANSKGNINPIRCVSAAINEDQVTHTGQQWKSDDYRLSRFVNKSKQVNPNFAVKLIDEVPPTPSHERVVWCNGGGGPMGHPKVYINLDQPGNHACGYCGLRFVYEPKH